MGSPVNYSCILANGAKGGSLTPLHVVAFVYIVNSFSGLGQNIKFVTSPVVSRAKILTR